VVNRANAVLLRHGIGPSPQHLLAVPGRRTGVLRTTPVAVVTLEGYRYVVAGYAGSDWVKNARAAGWGTLTRGEDTERVTLTEVPVEQRSPILREFTRQVRGGRSFLTVTADATPEEFSRALEKHPTFLLQPEHQLG
jgi:deazaflavin-dependent oxidoreductase (nitroreductase family)